MWGCGNLCGAWTVCGQVSLSSTSFAFPTIQKERFIFDRREWGQDIERRRECERERRGQDTYWQDDFRSTRDESWSITVLFIFVSHWSWSGLLTNSGQWDTKGCLPGVSQKIILTDRGLFTGRETHFFSTPFLLACDPILWDHKSEHIRGHSLASMSGDVASTSRVAEWKGRSTLRP